MPRRLAAIMVADLVGYSRMMGQDETGTLGRYSALRHEVIDPAIAYSGGRIFKAMGDALLVEFASVLDAVACALVLAERMDAAQDQDALQFRFGIHLGDVIDEDGDLFGDAVNIAARIESEAEPGGIVLTEDAARQVRGKIGHDLADLGERSLKNIAEPRRLFAVGTAPAARRRTATSVGRLPTLALEPLRHLGDSAQAFITEGLNQGLSSALALFSLFDLVDGTGENADFVFGGTVQVAGPRARMTVGLTERASGRRIWGTTYDRTTDDPFRMQDDLIATIASTMGEAIPDEAARALSGKAEADWTTYDHITDGLQKLHRMDPEGLRLARDALMTALSIDPGNDTARLVLAWINFLEARWAPDPEARLREARTIAEDQVRQNERNPGAWRLLSRIEARSGNPEKALSHARRALEINPYDSDIMVTLGTTLTQAGAADEGLPLIDRAIRINPYAPSYYWVELALARLLTGDAGAALDTLKTLSRPVIHSRQTSIVALVELDRIDEARSLAAEHLAEYPDATADRASPVTQGPEGERYRTALIQAGIPTG